MSENNQEQTGQVDLSKYELVCNMIPTAHARIFRRHGMIFGNLQDYEMVGEFIADAPSSKALEKSHRGIYRPKGGDFHTVRCEAPTP